MSAISEQVNAALNSESKVLYKYIYVQASAWLLKAPTLPLKDTRT